MARYNDTSSLGWKILSLFLALIMVAGVITGIVFWQKGNIVFNPVEQEQPDETPDENGGMVIPDESAGTGMKLMSAKIAPENYAEYGISPMADTAYQLTATITPENATNKAVDWTIAFVNPASAWATDKTVTDYVTVTPTADGALTATVTCVQAFGEQINVRVTSRDNPEATATLSVNYVKKIDSVDFSVQYLPSGETVTVVDFFKTDVTNLKIVVSPLYGVGTIDPDNFVFEDVKLGLVSDFLEKCDIYGLDYLGPVEYSEGRPLSLYLNSGMFRGMADFNSRFKALADFNSEFLDSVLYVLCSYSSSYNGEVYSSGTFDENSSGNRLGITLESLFVPVTDISFSSSNIVF